MFVKIKKDLRVGIYYGSAEFRHGYGFIRGKSYKAARAFKIGNKMYYWLYTENDRTVRTSYGRQIIVSIEMFETIDFPISSLNYLTEEV